MSKNLSLIIFYQFSLHSLTGVYFTMTSLYTILWHHRYFSFYSSFCELLILTIRKTAVNSDLLLRDWSIPASIAASFHSPFRQEKLLRCLPLFYSSLCVAHCLLRRDLLPLPSVTHCFLRRSLVRRLICVEIMTLYFYTRTHGFLLPLPINLHSFCHFRSISGHLITPPPEG